MQVKKFEAPTMQEALKVIKRELGPEAIILSTKHIKGGFGLMSKASVEVTAAIADKSLKKKQMAEKDLPDPVKEKIWNSKAEKQREIYDNYFERQLKSASRDRVDLSASVSQRMEKAQPVSQTVARPSQQQAPTKISKESSERVNSVSRERRYIDITDDDTPMAAAKAPISSSTDRVKSLEKDIEHLKSLVVEMAVGASARGESAEIGMSDELVKAMQDLIVSGVEKKYSREIIKEASFDLNNEQKEDADTVRERVASHLMNEIKVGDLLDSVGARSGKSDSSIVALVGPTGVGKTTTIAKIASLGILEKRLRVGLINLDSYKVAAADQLATYAKIMNVPFRSVSTKEELLQAIYDFSSLDMVLIDTTGRSQKDQENLLQLRHMLGSVEGLQSVLLMSATTKDSDMNEVVSRFKIFNPIGLVFSKLDETNVYGCIYNVQKKTGLPLLYFTVGQRVPEDIEKASAERVVDLIIDL